MSDSPTGAVPDPFETTPPPAPQSSPEPPPTGSAAVPSKASLTALLDSMGPDARERPNSNLAQALAGIGGALAAIGVIVAIANDSHKATSVMLASAVVFAIALAARVVSHRDDDLRPAAVGAGLVSLAAFVAAFTALTEIRIGLGLVAGFGLFFVAWLAPGFRGRSAFLTVAALMLVFGVSSLATGSSSSNRYGSCDSIYLDPNVDPAYYPETEGCTTSDGPFDQVFGGGGIDEDSGIIVLILGGLLAVGVWQLDRRGYQGVGTSLVAATLLSTIGGTGFLYATLGGTGATLLTVGVGILISVVGNAGKRRAMTWWGSAITAAGFIAFLAVEIEPEKKASIGALFVLAGAALVIVPMFFARMRASSATSPSSSPQVPPAGV